MTISRSEHEDLQRRARELENELDEIRTRLAMGPVPGTSHLASATGRATDFAVIVIDVGGIIVEWSDSAERVLGWSAAAVIGQSIDMCFTPEDRQIDRAGDEMRLARAEGRADDERWHLRADGSRFWASGEMTPAFHEDGTIVGFIKILRDRTEQHVSGLRLAESELRYRTLFDALDAGFCVIEMKYAPDGKPIDYKFVEMNRAFIRQTGLENAQGKWIKDLVPAHEQHWFDIYGEVARTRKPVRLENAADALGRWYDVQALPAGRPELSQVAVLFNDISDRRQAELNLQRLASKLEEEVEIRTTDRNQLWELSTDIMLRCHVNGDIIAVNPAWTPMLGWSEEDLIGRSIFDFIHPDDVLLTRKGAANSAEGMPLRHFENRYRTKSGSYRWIDWSTRPALDIINAVGRDVTEEKEKAETLERMEAQLRQSQKMEAVGQLTGGLAHDFNNLLAGINGNLELLSVRLIQGRLSDMDRYVSAAQGAVKRAAALTHRLLAFSRRQTLDPTPTDVAALIVDLEELLRRSIGPDREMTITSSPDLWTTMVDRNQLENALLNLSINARDAMPDGGRIDIVSSNLYLDEAVAREFDLGAGDYVTVAVSDAGTGMSVETAARAFDPFFTTKPIGQGTGLGLSMIYGFARQSGGHVSISTVLGRGTTVRIYLPRFAGAAMPAGNQEHTSATSVPAGGAVLVVDDEPTLRMLISEVLEDSGYTVIEASDGPAGLKLLQSDMRIDMLVSDVGLPGGMNGRQLADVARTLRPGLQVLFITGYAEGTATGKHALEPGMHVLTKPFLMETLLAKVSELIARPG